MFNGRVIGAAVASVLFTITSVCSADLNGLVLKIRTEHENLDRGTKVYATVKANGEVVAKEVVVAAGEVAEDTDHTDVAVDFTANVPEDTRFTIELTHPGVAKDAEPHWRMTFTVNAVQVDGKKRPTNLRLESSTIYETKGRRHLNFEDSNRSSGEMPFKVE